MRRIARANWRRERADNARAARVNYQASNENLRRASSEEEESSACVGRAEATHRRVVQRAQYLIMRALEARVHRASYEAQKSFASASK